MVIRLWHLSHSACHSSPGHYQHQQAHPMCGGRACIGMVGGKDVRGAGVEGVKGGIRRITLFSVINKQKFLIKSQNYYLFCGEWRLFHLIKLAAFHM